MAMMRDLLQNQLGHCLAPGMPSHHDVLRTMAEVLDGSENAYLYALNRADLVPWYDP